MSATENVPQLISHLKTLTPQERWNCMKLYMVKTKGPYFVPHKLSKQAFSRITVDPCTYVKFPNQKYTTFTTLLDFLRKDAGRDSHIHEKFKYQLKSDCNSINDLNELSYHLYKSAPRHSLIEEIRLQYKKEFHDNFFDTIKTLSEHHETHQIVGCNKQLNQFQTDKGIVILVENSKYSTKLLNTLRRRINEYFIVNNSKNHTLGTKFIHDPDKPPLFVETYSWYIVSVNEL
ncbi:hypothetical protein QKT26_gp31 [Carcinus maenas nudivirus]|uniref:Uncharacterized protein n=1 Tax=Carcinus maenas nudivirus TaxID=2880837 RepID=A0AAE8Y0S4_9VIRU|nr:hypothetical protein QKT26_gp31 [Carcinus maenas nudivirus]UBZ25621.1 hypothetical protein CmNV_031 [Carcinus maenas nudivirus]